ncbi:unnamed protein product [Gordionus sp. m RMFG-2023]
MEMTVRKSLDLCGSNNLKIENTFFSCGEVNRLTFRRGSHKWQIDFFISNVHGWYKDVMAMTSVNLTDHKMIKDKILERNIWGTSIGLNNNSNQTVNTLRRQNINYLQIPEIRELFDRRLCEKAKNFESL